MYRSRCYAIDSPVLDRREPAPGHLTSGAEAAGALSSVELGACSPHLRPRVVTFGLSAGAAPVRGRPGHRRQREGHRAARHTPRRSQALRGRAGRGTVGCVPDFASEEYLTVDEVARRLKLNPQTIRNWIDRGSMPAVRIGRRVRVLRSDFDRLVQTPYRSDADQVTGEGLPAEGFWDGTWQPPPPADRFPSPS